MDDIEGMAAVATAEAPAGGEATPQPAEGATDSVAEATGGEVAGEQQGPVPYDRFQQVIQERNQLREQHSQLSSWQQLQEAGFTPEAVLQALYAQTQGTPETPQQYQPSPEEQFGGWLEAQGVDAWGFGELPVANQVALRQAFQFAQWQEQQEQRQQQAELSARHAEVLAQTQQVAQKWPVFQDADFTNLLHANWAAEVQHARNQGRPDPALSETAGRIAAKLEAHVKGELARYSAAKQGDAAVPVAAGGSSTPPAPKVNFHGLSATEQDAYLDSWLHANRQPA